MGRSEIKPPSLLGAPSGDRKLQNLKEWGFSSIYKVQEEKKSNEQEGKWGADVSSFTHQVFIKGYSDPSVKS